MNEVKRIKPNLLDPVLQKKIINKLKPPVVDYWGPAKSGIRIFYEKYIKPNIGLFLFLLVIIFFFIYRYRSVKKERERKELENIIQTHSHENENTYIKELLDVYHLEKERLREPV